MKYRDIPTELFAAYVEYLPKAAEVLKADTLPVLQTRYGNVPLQKSAVVAAPLTRTFGNVARLLGGPNALTSALLGGALSAGLGWGAGKAIELVTPRDKLKRGRLSGNLALLGGLGGAGLLGLIHGAPLVHKYGWRGLLTPGPFNGNYINEGPDPNEWMITAKQPVKTAEWLRRKTDVLKMMTGIDFERDELFEKMSVDAGFALPKIPVDQFNNMIFADQHTPQPVQAAAAGLTTGAALATGSPLVSPFDVGRIAVGMGSGYLSGMLVGKTLGALAGVSPDVQKKLQQTGVWAGMLKTIVPLAFGK